jgi:hypothetical protein
MSWGQNLGDKACVPHKYGVAKNNADIGHNERPPPHIYYRTKFHSQKYYYI